ncbi:MAG: VWA domain-containing protein [Actinomycetaceae bacterium]|nr:VWA domain-containing protein [Actinomycetaceae bacterium]
MSLAHLLPPAENLVFVLVAAILIAVGLRRAHPTRRRAWARRAGIVAVICLLGLAPALPSESTSQSSDLTVTFVVDRTTSMTATDMPGGTRRIDAVATDLKILANELAGARFQVIGVGSRANLDVPATTDAAALVAYAETLTPEVAHAAHGSALARAIPLLRQSARIGVHGPRALVIASDGENTDEDEATPSTWNLDGRSLDAGSTLLYGTSSGGPMRAYLGGGRYEDSPVIDPDTGREAVSRADSRALARIASQLGIEARERTDDTARDLARDLKAASTASDKTDLTKTRPLIWPLVWLLLALVALEAYDTARLLSARRMLSRRIAKEVAL